MSIVIGPGWNVGPGWVIGGGNLTPTLIVTQSGNAITTQSGDTLIITGI